MTAVFTTVSTIIQSLLTYCGQVLTWITAEGHELALIPVAVLFLYSAISVFRRIAC